MREERLTRTLLTGALSLLMVAVVLPAGLSGQDDQQQSEESEQSMDKLQYRFDVLKDRVEYLEEELEEQKTSQDESESLLSQEFKPGYEKPVDYMQPSREGEMNLRLGRAGPMSVYMGVDTVGRFQYFDEEDMASGGTALNNDQRANFQTAYGDLEFLAAFKEEPEQESYLEVYFDFSISSRAHPDLLQGNQGYLLLKRLPEKAQLGPVSTLFENINVKAGDFELDFGDHRYRRSQNATVQKNPLIGNYVVDPRATDIGVEVMSEPSSEPGDLNLLAGVTNGHPSQNYAEGSDYAVHGKAWMNMTESLRGSLSGYQVDLSSNQSGYPVTGDASNLFTTLRDGGPYGRVTDGGNAPGQVFPGGGQDVLAFQGDLTYRTDAFELYGNLGWVRDKDSNGSISGDPREEWYYGALEGVYDFTERFYGAARFSAAFPQDVSAASPTTSVPNVRGTTSSFSTSTTGSSGSVTRFQIGGGYWLTDTVLAKLEFVHQNYSGFDASARSISGIDAERDPSFTGVISEVSFQF